MSTLHGIRTGNKAAHTNQLIGQTRNALRRNTGNVARPSRVFRDAVRIAAQIGGKLRITDAVTGEKRIVLRLFALNFKRDRHHQRRIGIRADRDPLSIEERRAIVAHRADINDAGALLRQLLQRRFQRMFYCAT